MLQHRSIVSSLLLVFSGAKQAAHMDCTIPMEHGLYHTYGTDLGTIPKAGYGTDVVPYLWNEPCSIVWYRWAPRGLYHTFKTKIDAIFQNMNNIKNKKHARSVF